MKREAFQRALAAAALLLWSTVPALAASEAIAPGVQLFESRRFEEARKFFEPYVAKNPKDPDGTYYLGRTLFAQEKYEPAAGQLEKSVEIRPNADALLWLGRAYGQFAMQASVFKQAGLAKKCKAAWDRAVALDPNNLEVRGDLIQYYLRAPGFMGGSVEKAREQAAEIRKRDAVRGALAAVTIHLYQKDNAAAEKELAEAIRKAPADPRPRMTLGALQQEAKRWNEAFETFEATLKTDPESYDALYQIGKTGALSGQRLDRAEECLKRYLAHTPKPGSAPLANAHYRLGMVYEKKANKTLARTHYKKAVELDKGLKEAKEALSKLG
ncbi:MAG TPA: tetratricopeptide repeat protein [Thermoanaerobaculia bacterium]|nr:tetratricopeptide repeat protein [Thermoanaerobaculia bacterium]